MCLKIALTHCVKAVSRPQHMEGESSGLTKLGHRLEFGKTKKLKFGRQSTWGTELCTELWSSA